MSATRRCCRSCARSSSCKIDRAHLHNMFCKTPISCSYTSIPIAKLAQFLDVDENTCRMHVKKHFFLFFVSITILGKFFFFFCLLVVVGLQTTISIIGRWSGIVFFFFFFQLAFRQHVRLHSHVSAMGICIRRQFLHRR
jgi:hypothetical protein